MKRKNIGPRGPRPYHHGDLKNSLIKAALEILNERGQGKLSLRATAARAGVSASAPYRHFTSKDSLLAAVAEEGFRRLAAAMGRAAHRHPGDPARQLEDLARAYLSIAGENADFFRVMFGPYADGEPAGGVEKVCEKVYADLVRIFKRGVESGYFRTETPESLAFLYWASLHGFSMLMVDRKLEGLGPKGGKLEALLAGWVAMGVRGMRT